MKARLLTALAALKLRAVIILAWAITPFARAWNGPLADLRAALARPVAWRVRILRRVALALWCLVVGHKGWQVVNEGPNVPRPGFRPVRQQLALCTRCGFPAIRVVEAPRVIR